MAITMGEGSYIEKPLIEMGTGDIRIGKYCSIGERVSMKFYPQHRPDWVTTYPFPSPGRGYPEASHIGGVFENKKWEINVGNDVWIGSDTTLMGGARIGDGCVIGAHSVVAGEIPPYSIAVGNPCKRVKRRFTRQQIDELMEIRWWEWPREKIVDHIDLLCGNDIDAFVKAARGLE